MSLLSLSKVNKYFGERCLFENISFSVEEHDKIGLIGANGTGKTTLFKTILEQDTHDGGEIFLPKSTEIGYLEQHVGINSSLTVYEEVLTVYSHLKEMEEKMLELTGNIEAGIGDAAENAQRLHKITEEYKEKDGYMYKNIARASLIGLGFTEEDLNKPFSLLSGGQKTRVSLCKILLSGSNLLLLDEPTNHLDIASVEWLENFLSNYKGAFIVISHDRFFLDKVTNKTFELEYQHLTAFDGNYSRYLKLKEENEKYVERRYENTMREIKRIEGIIEQQKRWNRERNIKTAEHKQKSVDRLKETLIIPKEELDNIKPRFEITRTGANEVLDVKNLSKSFDDNCLFSDIYFLIRRKERVFLLGDNGCGKTTLFKIMMSNLEPDTGSIKIGASVDVGYFDQTQATLDYNKTLFDEVADNFPDLTITDVRNALAGFLFKADDAFKFISELSGGERARLMLLKLMLKRANFLLLDEPTNHLDIKSREMLEDALEKYEGTIFAISHDRYFINKLSTRIMRMNNKVLENYDGNYSYFLEKCAKTTSEKNITDAPKVSSEKEDYLAQKKTAADERKRKNRIEKLETEIALTEEKISKLENELTLPENVSDYVKCAEISAELDELNEKLILFYDEWESLQ
ncbi:MAG: ABC-F family ATP-binding cassette domain-containing protein [Clostridia bacterium]|nr:ABC-F family ATP-binding cassette domain-containing protein [Clostridia bacterium]